MKIDHNGKGMSIELDKIPSFLYINEDGYGCGQVYIKGIRIKPLQEVEMKAKTADSKSVNPLGYKITYLDLDQDGRASKTISSGIKSRSNCEVMVSITDTDIFKNIWQTLTELTKDESIPIEIRRKYINQRLVILAKEK